MTERRKITTLDRLKIIVRQARCPRCGEKLGDLAGLQWDHVVPLALGGADEVENLQALHTDCHAEKTRGRGATTHGSDIHAIAKVRRLSKKEEAFRSRLLERDAPTAYLPADHEDRGARRPKKPWPSRPFPSRKKEPRT